MKSLPEQSFRTVFVLAVGVFMAASGKTGIFGILSQTGASDPFEGVCRKITQFLKETAASGVAVAVAKDGKIVWEQGFGFTSHDGITPVTPDTMFSLASITKALTATGLMVLVDRKLIDLDKPANDYLGEGKLMACLEGSPVASIKNLIYHTAGLPMHYHLFYADRPQRPPRRMNPSRITAF